MSFEIKGQYKGLNVYLLSKKEFLMLEEDERAATDCMWLIREDNNLIYNGKIIGKVTGTNVHEVPQISYRIMYGKDIRAEKKTVSPQVETVTERPTLDALCRQGSEALKALCKEAENSYLDYANDGAELLEELYQEGLKLIQKKG